MNATIWTPLITGGCTLGAVALTWAGQLLLRRFDGPAARNVRRKELRVAALRFGYTAKTLRVALVDEDDWRDRFRSGRAAAFLFHDKTALPLERLLAAAVDVQTTEPALADQVDALIDAADELLGALGQDQDTFTAASEKYQETFSAIVQAIRAKPARWWRRLARWVRSLGVGVARRIGRGAAP